MSNFWIRAIVTVFLLPIIISLIFKGDYYFNIVAVILAFLGAQEWLFMIQKKRILKVDGYFHFALAGGFILALNGLYEWGIWLFVALAFCYFMIAKFASSPVYIRTSLGLPYLFFPILSLIWLRGQEFGMFYIFFMLTVVVCTDIGAYLVGKTIGGPKLAPKISPGKTWSGSVGGVLIAILGASLFEHFWTFGLSSQMGVLCAFILSVASQCGDLFESYMKRLCQVKDSGTLIPGHGGVLDRVDGYMFAAPVLFLWVYLS